MPQQQVMLTRAAALTPSSVQAQAASITTTDELGRFAFDVSEPGQYTLSTRTDTTGALARITVTRGADGSLTADEVTLQSAELGSVTGTVAGQGVGVMVYLAGTSYLALTDTDGDYAITRVPAGSYEVIATVNGIHSQARSITVTAGETTAVSGALQLAPTITNVTPGHLMLVGVPAPRGLEIGIEGSGFGDTQGLSRVHYYGIEVPRHAITRWSDNEIVVNLRLLEEWVGDLLFDGGFGPLDLESMVFSVETPAGVATSDTITGAYISWIYGYDMRVEFSVSPFNLDTIADLSVKVDLVSARLVDGDGHPVNDPRTSSSSGDAYHVYTLEPESIYPIILTFTVDDPRFEPTPSEPLVMQEPILTLDSHMFPRPGEELTGTLLTPNDTPYADYSDFSLRYEGYPESETTPDIDSNTGRLSASMPIPAGHTSDEIRLEVLYQGRIAGGAYLHRP